MSVEFRAIKASELEECLDLWGSVFERVGRGYFPPYFHGDPWFRRAYTRVCAVDGKLASVIQICERRVRVGETELIMGGIGNVATLPEHRGKGYSQRLLSDCAKVMHDRRIDFSVLFTGIMPFYEKALWRSVPQRMFTGKLRADLRTEVHPKYAVRPVCWDADMPAIRDIADQFSAGRPLTTVRTPEYWTGYLSARFGGPESTLVAESNGRPVGYLFFGSNSPNCWLKEIGWLPGHEACADVLIHETAVRALELGNEELFANLPHEPEILAAFDGVVTSIEPREPMGMMCRVTSMRSMCERMLPELDRRARRSDMPDGAVSLDTETGSMRFTINEGHITLGARRPVRVPLSQLEFFCLLFGIKSADELGISMPDEAREIVSALFPAQRPVFWLADHF